MNEYSLAKVQSFFYCRLKLCMVIVAIFAFSHSLVILSIPK